MLCLFGYFEQTKQVKWNPLSLWFCRKGIIFVLNTWKNTSLPQMHFKHLNGYSTLSWTALSSTQWIIMTLCLAEVGHWWNWVLFNLIVFIFPWFEWLHSIPRAEEEEEMLPHKSDGTKKPQFTDVSMKNYGNSFGAGSHPFYAEMSSWGVITTDIHVFVALAVWGENLFRNVRL